MPIIEGLNGEILYTAPQNNDRSLKTGTAVEEEFAIVDRYNVLKQIQFQVNPLSAGPGVFTINADIDGDTTLNISDLSPGWSLTGNSSTDPLIDYVGTSDNTDFILAANGSELIRLYGVGAIKIIPSIFDSNEKLTINPLNRLLADATEAESINWDSRILKDVTGTPAVGWQDRLLQDTSNNTSVNWRNRQLDDAANNHIILWNSGLGFFGTNPVSQQIGGAASASGAYGATEQAMLEKAYAAMRTYGLLT